MTDLLGVVFRVISVFFLIYLLIYATYLFLSVLVGAWRLYHLDKMRSIKNEIKHDYYFPVSVLVPAYNEQVTIVDTVENLLKLEYRLYEIIVIDDGSTDNTAALLIDHFRMRPVSRPIRELVKSKPAKEIYEAEDTKVRLTLIRKENGGKGDALNMGINVSSFPYYVCIDADSILQTDSLERIVQPVMEDEKIIAVGGLIRVAQCVAMDEGRVQSYHLPWNLLTCMQVMEYDRAFLASRILLDTFNGNLIVSGAFGLFRKDLVAAVGGYDSDILGEDMELIVKLHEHCRSNKVPYVIRYEPNAVCWSQAPSTLGDIGRQRRRWHLGLFQSLVRHKNMFFNFKYGSIGTVSFIYYVLYELLSPFVEAFGLLAVIAAALTGYLNVSLIVTFFLVYAVYGAVLSMTAFFQRIYTQNLKIGVPDIFKAVIVSLLENVFFRFILDYIRIVSFIGYRKKKQKWGEIKREKYEDFK